MYLQPAFEERRVEPLHEHIRAHALATFITAVDGEVTVDHMPLLVDPTRGAYGVLHGHMPRENPATRILDGTVEAVAVFLGPDAYITPSWYPAKHAHGRVVPTWNYAVVHARGRPRVVDDADWLLAHLEALTETHESRETLPWKVSDAPAEFTAQMIARLVGIEMPIDALVGKWKMSQNRPRGDRLGVAAGLRARGDERSLAVAELVAERGRER
jgi:transcriptional regulator